MPSNDELYLDWLKTSKSSQVHILQIESGANTTAERLSFSDRAFNGVYPDSVGESGGWDLGRIESPGRNVPGEVITGFTPDGLVCYEGDNEYRLLKPWDPSVRTLLRSGLFGYRSMAGTKLYRLSGTVVSEYNLLTPWNTSTNSLVSTEDLSAYLDSVDAFAVTENGQYMYLLGTESSTRYIAQLEFGTAGDVDTLSLVGMKDLGFGINSLKAIWVDPDSTVIWVLLRNIYHRLQQYVFGTAEDVTTLAADTSFNVQNLASGASSIATNPAGTLLYMAISPSGTNKIYNVGNVAPVIQNVLIPKHGFSQDLDSLSFTDFSIENDGRFDALFQDCDVRGHEFRLLFGDVSWDLGESEGPYRFREIAQGVINDVVHESANKIVFKPLPRKINLLTTVGGVDTPVAYGHCLNIPVVLIDSATDHYRSNTVYTDQPMPLRDNGVTLTAGSGNDYELTLVDDEFFGDLTTDGSAYGELTADVNSSSGRSLGVKKIVQDIIRDSLPLPNSSYFGVKFTGFSSQDAEPLDFKTNELGTIAYMLGGVTNTIYEYTIATGYDILALVYSGNSFSFDSEDTAAVSFDIHGTTLIMAGSENNSIYRYTMGVDISALVYESDTRVISEDSDIRGVAIDKINHFGNDDTARILVLGNENKSIQTYGNLQHFRCADSVHYGSTDGVKVPDASLVNISNNDLYEKGATIAYVIGRETNRVFQFELPGTHEGMLVETARYDSKSYYLGDEDPLPSAAVVSADGGRLFMVGESVGHAHEYQLSFNYQLPTDLLRTNIPGGNSDYECGTWIGRETQLGSVVKELLKSLSCSFSVNRSGGLSAIRLQDPESSSPLNDGVVTISEADLVYENYATRIVHVKSDQTINEVSLLHSKNHTVQNRGSLGAISEDLKKLYSSEYQKLQKSNLLFNCSEQSDMVLETLLTDPAECQDELDRVAELRSVVRDFLSFTVDSDVLPVNNSYGVGNVVVLDLVHPRITFGQKALIVGYSPDNVSRKTKLTVYK